MGYCPPAVADSEKASVTETAKLCRLFISNGYQGISFHVAFRPNELMIIIGYEKGKKYDHCNEPIQ